MPSIGSRPAILLSLAVILVATTSRTARAQTDTTTTDAFTPDLIMDGNLGIPFLRDWVVTLDLQAGTGWIAPAGA